MIFRKATQEDLDYVCANPYEGAVKDYPYAAIPEDNCYAIIFQEKLVGVGGLQIKWTGVGLLWLILTAECRKDGVFGIIALDAIRDKTNELITKNNLWRAEAYIRPDFPQAIKMVEFLGFKRDCTMEMFFPDKSDSYLYSRIIK